MIAFLLALTLIFPRAVTTGVASWYADPGARQGSFYAAVPGYRGHPFYAYVRPYGKAGPRVRVLVMDSCQCYVGRRDERAIDLSWAAFRALGYPLSKGIARVVIER
jgi:Lytic transglycolase